jgi:phosphopantothenoylcysteine decarboxylase/phosphopantothenate--cysteine ligase
LLGVTGGIAAYKAAEFLRVCQTLGAEVRVVMTPAATEFVTPLTFQALSGMPVHTKLLDAEQEAGMGHISLARWADVIIVAPASADFVARLASGMANDLLSTVVLASTKKLMLAPAMNQVMYTDEKTQQNLAKLAEQGATILGPDAGLQACGDVGFGRMLEPEALAEEIINYFHTGELAGLKVLLTAGPTREAIDPVRYISNHSSGKMGYSVAQACVEAGATVTLVSGPVQIEPPSGVETLDVVSAEDMFETVMARSKEADIFIAAAAVADYTPLNVESHKVKKNKSEIQLNLSKTKDILQKVAGLPAAPFCVGFAAETENVEEYARVKLDKKKLDMVAANLVGAEESGFNSDNNALTVLWSNGRAELGSKPKSALAKELVTLIAKRFYEKNSV